MKDKPILIAGPCMAESLEVMRAVAAEMVPLAEELGLDYYFKASYDKANRTSKDSARGPGLNQAMLWFQQLKEEFPGLKILTDIHTAEQALGAAVVCDALQIPAMLCRQTDLMLSAAKTGKPINVKKGQFLAPESMGPIAAKAPGSEVWLTERGTTFGHGDLVVDMRGLKAMAETGHKVIFDITHSTQKPPAAGRSKSGADRSVAPLLARAACATGFVDGIFMEVHPNPAEALSDGPCSLPISQAKRVTKQCASLIKATRKLAKSSL